MFIPLPRVSALRPAPRAVHVQISGAGENEPRDDQPFAGGLYFGMNFVWHPKKAEDNLKKHGVSFEEACTVYLDPLSLTGADPDHSKGEERWLTLGISRKNRLLIVSHTNQGETVRIISARLGTPAERKLYEEG